MMMSDQCRCSFIDSHSPLLSLSLYKKIYSSKDQTFLIYWFVLKSSSRLKFTLRSLSLRLLFRLRLNIPLKGIYSTDTHTNSLARRQTVGHSAVCSSIEYKYIPVDDFSSLSIRTFSSSSSMSLSRENNDPNLPWIQSCSFLRCYCVHREETVRSNHSFAERPRSVEIILRRQAECQHMKRESKARRSRIRRD